MAVPIECYTVVVKRKLIDLLLEREAILAPNVTALADADLWRCGFMAEVDALTFLDDPESAGLNVSQGSDPDAVLVCEFDRSIRPGCDWLIVAAWQKAVIAWLAGTTPETVVARPGWDPKLGSGMTHFTETPEHLEWIGMEGSVQVFRDRQTGELFYVGRIEPPLEVAFQDAGGTILDNLVDAGQPPVTGEAASQVGEAVATLKRIITRIPDAWRAHRLLGKGEIALGNLESAYESFQRAFQLETDVEPIARELAGTCLATGRFAEAVTVAERAVAIEPDNTGLIGNLALAYLLAGQVDQAGKTIAAACQRDPYDPINLRLRSVIQAIAEGRRSPPKSLVEL